MMEDRHPLLPEGLARLLYGSDEERRTALEREPGLHNALGMETEWERQGADQDYLRRASPYFPVKALSTLVYHRFFDPFLETISGDAVALDAGCGIGRFTVRLAERFRKVTALDPCRASLSACHRHLRERGLSNVDLRFTDLSWLEDRPANQFDLVFAVELLSYVSDPGRALRQMLRVARPGAWIFLSVEAKPGALAVQEAGGPRGLLNSMAGRPVIFPSDRFVRFFDPNELAELLAACGVEVSAIQESHYFGEGPFWQSLEEGRLDDPAYVNEILAAERACREDARLAPFARVLSAVGTRRA